MQSMDVFPKKDEFEIRQTHAVVDQLELWRELVSLKNVHPLRLVEGRDGAHDGFPVHNGKARACQARHSPDTDHHDDQKTKEGQPKNHGRGGFFLK